MRLQHIHIQKIMIAPALLFAALFLLGASATVAAISASTSISSTISSTLGLSSSGTVTVNVLPSASGAQTIASDTVTVSTSDTAGYTLQLSETGAGTAMVSGGNSIPASSGTQVSPLAMLANTWGYHVDNIGGFGATTTVSQSSAAIGSIKFAAVPVTASPDTIKTTSGTASSDTTAIWYEWYYLHRNR
jgi:hypothetical protein